MPKRPKSSGFYTYRGREVFLSSDDLYAEDHPYVAAWPDRFDDVVIIDGGLVSLPGRPYIGPYGISSGLAYACMAETMLLTLERRFENTGFFQSSARRARM